MLGFSVGMEAFDELLLINVPWSQEFSDVLRICVCWTLGARDTEINMTDRLLPSLEPSVGTPITNKK